MTLTMRRSDRRDRRLCRIGVMLVVVSLVINMVAVPKAKAVVVDATAAFGAAAATAAINGTTASTLFTGMTTSAATNGIILYMDSYAAATGAAASGTALASTIGAGTVITAAGSLVLGAAATIALIKFVEWLRADKGIEPGGDPVTIAGTEIGMFRCGDVVVPALPAAPNDTYFKYLIFQFTSSKLGLYILPSKFVVDSGTLKAQASYSQVAHYWFVPGDSAWTFYRYATSTKGSGLLNDVFDVVYWSSHDILNPDGAVAVPASTPAVPVYEDGTEVVIQPNDEIQEFPDAIPEGQTMVISPGIANLPQDDPQAAADAIMQPIIDGTLNPTVTIEADPTVTPDPEPDPEPELPPDAPELPSNLGDLGNALTSRFPFSIPWDIYKAVKLLAAPAKAPYWEIDFMEPIKYRFDSIGDTTITLDFGKPEFEIIGITTRLTSTIGFCLALAAATKRFSWTA